MKEGRGTAALLLLCALLSALLCACGAPAPSGMYAPVDAKHYIEGVETAVFSVPEDYTVTMSSNTLTAEKGQNVFSLQCRHSDYYYNNLKANYTELKNQLLGLYGGFKEELSREKTVAGQKALEARYTLEISGERFDYVQYFFYGGKEHLYLFTCSAPEGQIDGELLSNVLATVSLERENYTPPAGYKAVLNASARALLSDGYELYIPDDWIFDTSMGQVCMRVPSSGNISTVMFHELESSDLRGYTAGYAEKYAKDITLPEDPVARYIVASVYRMTKEYKGFRLLVGSGDGAHLTDLSKSDVSSLYKEYLQTYTGESGLTFTYIEYTAQFNDFTSHGSGGLFVDVSKIAPDDGSDVVDAEAEYADYHVRQYFLRNGEHLYLFTYLSAESTFKNQENDAVKVVKTFVIKDGAKEV